VTSSSIRALVILTTAVVLGACAPTANTIMNDGGSTTNAPPTISGTPATSVTAGSGYSFTPSASDPEATDTLTFSVTNKPSWAQFSTSTGALTGTPTASDVGTTSGIVVSVSDGTSSVSLPAFNLAVTAAATNHAPTISGSPATSVTAGNTYSFTPTAADVDGNTLTFSIKNKPSWATFSSTTGKLSGTPASSNVGTTNGVQISVSDGSLSASLTAFNLAVVAAPVTTGSATLTWVAPTVNSDGTPLNDLAGYVIRYGTSASSYSSNLRVTDPTLQSYTVSNLPSGTYYFAVAAIDTSDNTSADSNQVSKTIP